MKLSSKSLFLTFLIVISELLYWSEACFGEDLISGVTNSQSDRTAKKKSSHKKSKRIDGPIRVQRARYYDVASDVAGAISSAAGQVPGAIPGIPPPSGIPGIPPGIPGAAPPSIPGIPPSIPGAPSVPGVPPSVPGVPPPPSADVPSIPGEGGALPEAAGPATPVETMPLGKNGYSTCVYDPMNGAGRHGSTMEEIEAPDFPKCVDFCYGTEDCVGCNFKESTQKCFMKKKVPPLHESNTEGYSSCVMVVTDTKGNVLQIPESYNPTDVEQERLENLGLLQESADAMAEENAPPSDEELEALLEEAKAKVAEIEAQMGEGE